jgi:hypothetical protein
MTRNSNDTVPGRWRIQVLYRPPRFLAHGEVLPQRGWAIMEETSRGFRYKAPK